MELGNMLFGNARGVHPVDRSLQEAFLDRVLTPLGFDGYGHPENGTPEGWTVLEPMGHTNGVFTIRPYWWGDCLCGWDEIALEVTHSPECYQTRLGLLRSDDFSENGLKRYDSERTKLCKEMGLDPHKGSEVHCTCDFPERYDQWFEQNKLGTEGHRNDCPIVAPNFECEPLGLTIKVYKYFMRDSYSNVYMDEGVLDRLAALV
ncbi:MAG: hypothetical protein JSS66_06740 [Armatimonadetes bacterium]|nr:hypothetical protein [Armatimonadota bacterium]